MPKTAARLKDRLIEIPIAKKQFLELGSLLEQNKEIQKALNQTLKTLAGGSDAEIENASFVKAEARKGLLGKQKFVLTLKLPAKPEVKPEQG